MFWLTEGGSLRAVPGRLRKVETPLGIKGKVGNGIRRICLREKGRNRGKIDDRKKTGGVNQELPGKKEAEFLNERKDATEKQGV